MNQRIHLIISGEVQGVGFRSWTRRQARELSLTGWVTNRDDGTVEVVAEGPRAVLEQLEQRCHTGPEVSWVSQVDVRWEQATHEFPDFTVI